VSIDPSGLRTSFAAAARALARGGNLDERLEALLVHGRRAAGIPDASLYLLGEDAQSFVPAGVPNLTADQLHRLTLHVEGDDDALVRAVRERRAVSGASAAADGGTGGLHLPLFVEDDNGAQEVEGVLVAPATDPAGDAAVVLTAIADLAAIAIRQARLELALAERADWYDRVAHTDPLTGLANRRTFDRVLELELARAARQQGPVSVALFDVDDLAGINERQGAEAGDDVLRLIASTLADSVRLVDTVARYGRDEFVLVAPGAAGRTVAQRVLDGVARASQETGLPIGLRVGLAVFPEDGATAEDLIGAAAEALGRAKHGGAGTIVAAEAASPPTA
jgi:diguanylate cyclase (GGDEF)-like protein